MARVAHLDYSPSVEKRLDKKSARAYKRTDNSHPGVRPVADWGRVTRGHYVRFLTDIVPQTPSPLPSDIFETIAEQTAKMAT